MMVPLPRCRPLASFLDGYWDRMQFGCPAMTVRKRLGEFGSTHRACWRTPTRSSGSRSMPIPSPKCLLSKPRAIFAKWPAASLSFFQSTTKATRCRSATCLQNARLTPGCYVIPIGCERAMWRRFTVSTPSGRRRRPLVPPAIHSPSSRLKIRFAAGMSFSRDLSRLEFHTETSDMTRKP